MDEDEDEDHIIVILEKRANLGKIERELGGGQMWKKLSGSEKIG